MKKINGKYPEAFQGKFTKKLNELKEHLSKFRQELIEAHNKCEGRLENGHLRRVNNAINVIDNQIVHNNLADYKDLSEDGGELFWVCQILDRFFENGEFKSH